MDPLPDVERRSGVTDEEIEDFLAQATEVESKIREIKEGKVSLEELLQQEREEAEKKMREAKLRDKRRAEYAVREAQRLLEARATEHEQWWRGAELLFSCDENAHISSEETVEDFRERMLAKYEIDYSRWVNWVPQDPASVEEAEMEQKRKDDVSNRAFEAANPKFCSEFLADKKEREQKQKKKEETAAAKRMRGNRYFKKSEFDLAMKEYQESLRLKGYEAPTLLNISQVHLKRREYDDAIEFATRASAVSVGRGKTMADFRAKAYWRRAAAKEAKGDTHGAADDLRTALKEPESSLREVVAARLAAVQRSIVDAENEKRAIQRAEKCRTNVSEHDSKTDVDHFAAISDRALDAVNGLLSRVDKLGDSNESLAMTTAAMRASPEAQALCRAKGGVKALCELLGANSNPAEPVDGVFDLDGHQPTSSNGTVKPTCQRTTKAIALSALAAATSGEPKSKAEAVQAGVLDVAAAALIQEEDCAPMAAELVAELVSLEDASSEALSVAANHVALLDGLTAFVGKSQTAQGSAELLTGVAYAARAMRDLVERGSISSPAAVEAFAKALLFADNQREDQHKIARSIRAEIRDYSVTALTKLAREPVLRDCFAVAVIGQGASNTACGILLNVAKTNKQPVALAAVSNACHDREAGARARDAAEAAGALALCVGVILQKQQTPEFAARAAQLLAKLATPDSQTVQALRKSSKALSQLAANALASEDDDWMQIIADSIVRTCAATLDGETAAALPSTFFINLANCIPEPQSDLGAVTAQSITLPAVKVVLPATVCNACKALIVGLNARAQLAFDLVANCAHERLVSALANFKDHAVRRNCAIVLAKLIGSAPQCKDRVRQLRGLEMITTLGSDLLASS